MKWTAEKSNIADFWNVVDETDMEVAENLTREDARLIAAAPELLEALKAMMRYDTIAAMMSLPIGKQMRDIYGQASAAIAKAEETSPGRANQSSEPPQPTEAKS